MNILVVLNITVCEVLWFICISVFKWSSGTSFAVAYLSYINTGKYDLRFERGLIIFVSYTFNENENFLFRIVKSMIGIAFHIIFSVCILPIQTPSEFLLIFELSRERWFYINKRNCNTLLLRAFALAFPFLKVNTNVIFIYTVFYNFYPTLYDKILTFIVMNHLWF